MIDNGNLVVGTVATQIDGNHQDPATLYIHNNDNTDDLLIGNADVTTTNGLRIKKQETLRIDLNPLEEVYVISTKAGHSLSWMRQTV